MTHFDIEDVKRQNLKRIMTDRGLTPTTLAKLIGVKQTHISACLSGGRNIGAKTIKNICGALKIDADEFIKPVLPADNVQHKASRQIVDVCALVEIIKEQNKRIEEQGRRIDKQEGLISSQKDLIAAQGDRITEQGKRIDMVADMAKTSQGANVVLARAVESMQNVLNKQHEKMIVAAETGDLKALGD